MNKPLSLAINKLSRDWPNLKWEFRDFDMDGKPDKMSQWQGEPEEDIERSRGALFISSKLYFRAPAQRILQYFSEIMLEKRMSKAMIFFGKNVSVDRGDFRYD